MGTVGRRCARGRQGAYRPAFQAAVAKVVPPDRRQSANAMVTAGGALGHRSDLPATGGVVAGPAGPEPGVLHGFAEGLREARRHRCSSPG